VAPPESRDFDCLGRFVRFNRFDKAAESRAPDQNFACIRTPLRRRD
jgi:hypothetical protein